MINLDRIFVSKYIEIIGYFYFYEDLRLKQYKVCTCINLEEYFFLYHVEKLYLSVFLLCIYVYMCY
jgi:hypothetical protein